MVYSQCRNMPVIPFLCARQAEKVQQSRCDAYMIMVDDSFYIAMMIEFPAATMGMPDTRDMRMPTYSFSTHMLLLVIVNEAAGSKYTIISLSQKRRMQMKSHSRWLRQRDTRQSIHECYHARIFYVSRMIPHDRVIFSDTGQQKAPNDYRATGADSEEWVDL